MSYLTVADIATDLGFSERTIMRHCARGDLPTTNCDTLCAMEIAESKMPFMKPEEVARRLDIGTRDATRLIKSGVMPGHQFSAATFRVERSEFEAWLSGRMQRFTDSVCQTSAAPSFVYAIRAVRGGPVKIGHCIVDAKTRLRGLQTSNPNKLELLGSAAGTRGDEQAILAFFADNRVRGEWFRPTPRVLAFAASLNSARDAVQALVAALRAQPSRPIPEAA